MQVRRSGICQDVMKIHSSYLNIAFLKVKTHSINAIEKIRKCIVLALKKVKYLQFTQFLKSYKEQFHDPEHNE